MWVVPFLHTPLSHTPPPPPNSRSDEVEHLIKTLTSLSVPVYRVIPWWLAPSPQ